MSHHAVRRAACAGGSVRDLELAHLGVQQPDQVVLERRAGLVIAKRDAARASIGCSPKRVRMKARVVGDKRRCEPATTAACRRAGRWRRAGSRARAAGGPETGHCPRPSGQASGPGPPNLRDPSRAGEVEQAGSEHGVDDEAGGGAAGGLRLELQHGVREGRDLLMLSKKSDTRFSTKSGVTTRRRARPAKQIAVEPGH